MEAQAHCPACGAPQQAEATCQDHFYQMLFWEAEVPARGAVHHLAVLCYHLQHPSLYSPEGLQAALRLLVMFVEQGVPPHTARQQMAADLQNHTIKIGGTADSFGQYAQPINWTFRAADVINNGADRYCESVRGWATAMLHDLHMSGNLPTA